MVLRERGGCLAETLERGGSGFPPGLGNIEKIENENGRKVSRNYPADGLSLLELGLRCVPSFTQRQAPG